MPKDRFKKEPETPDEANASKVKYYKHPWKTCGLVLIIPYTKTVDGKSIRHPGLSVQLTNYFYETDDPEIQELIKTRPEFHKDGIEEISKELAVKIKAGKTETKSQYQDGLNRVVVPK